METRKAGTIINLSELKQACSHCTLQELCLPMGINEQEMQMLEDMITRRRPIQRNEHLYRPGDKLTAIFAVRSGSIKTYALTEDGREQITGFHLPGELLGLDAINEGLHPCAAKALETTSICEMPFDKLEELATRVPGLQHQLLRVMSRSIQSDEQFMTLLGKKSSEERLASFLLGLSHRFMQRGYSALEFNLSMSRNDIANYLGLAVETVSRLFSRFQSADILEVNRKLVNIKDLGALKAAACAQENSDVGKLG